MDVAWDQLEAAGVPTGAARETVSFDAGVLRTALIAAVADPVDPVALLAWLSAYAHHWPSSFARVLGDVGVTARDSLAARPFPVDRYLKLRRIAIANLARVL